MSRISSCAACHGDILIPGSAQPADLMRCPLCKAQFLVHDVMASSIQAPPEAVAVEAPQAAVAAAVGPRLSRGQDLADFGESAAGSPRVQRKKPSVLGNLIGIFGGGILGLALGYVGLLYFGGPHYDFLKLQDKVPAWVFAKLAPKGAPAAPNEAQAPQRSLKDLLDAPDAPPAVQPPVEAPPFTTPPAIAPPPSDIAPPADATPPPAAPPGTESADAPAATATPIAAMPVALPGPKHVTLFRAADLQTAIADTGNLVGCPVCNSTGFVKRPVVTGVREVKGEKVERTVDRRTACDACGGKPSLRMTPEAYTRLCHLAEVVTFVDMQSAPEAELAPLGEQVQKLIGAAGADVKTVEAIGRLAGYQLDQPERKQNGVALAGTVQQITQEGKLYTMRIVLLGLPKVVTVVSWRAPNAAIKPHDRVIILGSVVDDPIENLNGYAGRSAQVVWGGMPVRLPTQ